MLWKILKMSILHYPIFFFGGGGGGAGLVNDDVTLEGCHQMNTLDYGEGGGGV